ncbi:MAG: hypothetical protein GF330_14530 [Candidatus Eisenbacteria bacterium]|nr:hypothetical protein [Candidatus Eisenbacteria bacterium]
MDALGGDEVAQQRHSLAVVVQHGGAGIVAGCLERQDAHLPSHFGSASVAPAAAPRQAAPGAEIASCGAEPVYSLGNGFQIRFRPPRIARWVSTAADLPDDPGVARPTTRARWCTRRSGQKEHDMRLAVRGSVRQQIGSLVVLLAALALLAGSASGANREIVDIIDLHYNDSDGEPAPPYTVGTPVEITGVVTVGYGTFTYEYTDVWVQDATGGIMVYDPAIPHEFAIGDSVTISGAIEQYRGMTEVDLDTYVVHGAGYELPAPAVLSCDDVEHAFLPDYSEPNEGRLVRLNNVSWTGSWPSFSGGVTLHDESGSCTMYIDGTTGVQEMTPPTGPFDVIGVVKQYAGYSPPYTSDYEIMPRSVDDIILLPGPQILVGPIETDIQHDRVTIHLETDTETTCSIDFGETETYELGTATDGVVDTVHDVVLDGLNPATIHHYRVTVEDGIGMSTTPDLLFCSGSAPGCTGQMRAIFNKSVDHDLATWEEALGSQDLEGWIIDRINATNYSIDIALYSFNLSAVADALIDAFDRGVQIRFCYDNRSPYQAEVLRLVNEGIVVIDDSFGPYNDGSGLMHNKLWIFDAESPDPADPWVYTGSWNLTTQGTTTDAQNVLMIQDQALAAVCKAEIDEMWGSETYLPNPDQSRFGSNKSDDTPKIFNVGGKEVELYFAPSDPWLGAMVAEVENADYATHFCIMSWTRYDLCNELEERWMNVPGFEVRGVFDSGESGNDYSQYWPMHGEGEYAWDPPADVWLDQETGTLHHKYMILDVDRTGSDPVLITGSANWSTNANDENDENVILVHDPAIANVYFQEFAMRYYAAGGSGDLTSSAPDAEEAQIAFRAGPNPARGTLRIQFALQTSGRVTCDLFDIEGRQVARLLEDDLVGGTHRAEWHQGDAQSLGAGIYYLRLATPDGEWSRRVTLVR